jgi:hypothetical protein
MRVVWAGLGPPVQGKSGAQTHMRSAGGPLCPGFSADPRSQISPDDTHISRLLSPFGLVRLWGLFGPGVDDVQPGLLWGQCGPAMMSGPLVCLASFGAHSGPMSTISGRLSGPPQLSRAASSIALRVLHHKNRSWLGGRRALLASTWAMELPGVVSGPCRPGIHTCPPIHAYPPPAGRPDRRICVNFGRPPRRPSFIHIHQSGWPADRWICIYPGAPRPVALTHSCSFQLRLRPRFVGGRGVICGAVPV